MEFLQELFVTVIVAVLFSFLVAKLVSLGAADSSTNNKPELSNSQNLDQANTSRDMDETGMEHDKLTAEGLKSEKRVEFVHDISAKVDKLSGESNSVYADEVIETELHPKLIQEGEKSLENRETETVEIEKSSARNDVLLEESEEEEEITGAVKDCEANKVKDEKKIEVVEIEDDWEGIERSELEKIFAEAAKFVECGDEEGLQMELFALHKVATEGPCREQPPMPLHFAARAKWNAWQRLGNMNPEVAMEQYVALVSAKVPNWMEDTSNGNGEPGSSEADNPGALASDLSTYSPNNSSITERNPEVTLRIEKNDLTEGPNLQTRAEE